MQLSLHARCNINSVVASCMHRKLRPLNLAHRPWSTVKISTREDSPSWPYNHPDVLGSPEK